jgi:hypothetical protein
LTIWGFRYYLRLLDFWWHLRLGQVIVETFSIPSTDIFSFTASGKPFLVQNWLTEVLYYLTYLGGGFELIIFMNTVVLVAALIPVYHLCWEESRNIRLAALVTGLPVFVMAIYASVRAQVLSFFFFSVFFWVLWRYSRGRGKFLWLLPPLMVLWVNLHGAFVLGLGLIVLFAFSETVRRITLGAQPNTLTYKQLGRLLLIFCFAVAMTLINPETFNIYQYVLQVIQDPGSQLYVTEWQPPKIDSESGLLCFFVPFLLTGLVLLYSKKRPNFTELLLFAGFSAFALTAIRNGVWYVIVTPPIITRLLVHVELGKAWKSTQFHRFLSVPPQGEPVQRKGRESPSQGINIAMVFVILVGCLISSPWLYPHVFGVPLWEPETPIGAMDFIEQQELEGRIFHPQVYGDYLIWRLWPRQKSCIDGRIHVFGGETVKDYLFTFHDTCWQQKLAGQEIQYLLLNKNPELFAGSKRLIDDATESPDWEILYQDDLSMLFEKAETP